MDHSCILPETHCYSGLSDKPSHIFLYIRKDSSLHTARKASVGYNHIKAAPKKYYLCVSVHPHSTQGGLYFEELPLPARNQRSDHSRYTWMHPGYIFRHIPFFSVWRKIPDFLPENPSYPAPTIFELIEATFRGFLRDGYVE